MASTTLWMDAANGSVEVIPPGEFTDDNGSTNEQPVVLLGTDMTFVVEGSVPDLLDYFKMVLTLLDRYAESR